MREVLVNEQVDTLWRVLPNGDIRPTSFVWRNKTRYVSHMGRHWEERVAGRTLRCYLVQAVDEQAYELRWDPASDVWKVHRAWLAESVV